MTRPSRLRVWLTHLLAGSVYITLDGGDVVGVAASLQGAELARIKHARQLSAQAGSAELVVRVERMVYNRQHIECHRIGDCNA